MNNLKKIRVMLEIKYLTKKFGSEYALNNLSFSANAPGLYLLIGINGSGKSTLFNAITGLMPSYKGSIILHGKERADDRRMLTGISTEPFYTEQNLTVHQVADISTMIKKSEPNEANYWLKYWKLDSALDKPFKALSTGMKKRLSLVVSLIGNPDYLFWDEPFNGLDPLGIDLLNGLIRELTDKGKYLFLSTHLLNELQGLKATCLVLKDGVLIQEIPQTIINDALKNDILQLLKTV
jgi:ABC-2 type transport system ATP-binding protein